MIFDLHSHTKYSPSDGIMEPRTLIKIARKRGLGGIAVTDHNTIKGGLKAREFQSDDLMVIVGSEIRTPIGEIMGLFLEEEVMPGSWMDVIQAIRDQNGLVVIPHPFDVMRRSAFHIKDEHAPHIDLVEGFNARCIKERYNEEARRYCSKHGLPMTAGSDAHFWGEVGHAGVDIKGDDPREEILASGNEYVGKRSSILYHVLTKNLKYMRKFSLTLTY